MLYIVFALASFIAISNAYAYYNITFSNTTVILNQNQSAHVVEQFNLFVSNSSLTQYLTNRNAVGLTLNYWEQIIYTNLLTEHIVGAGHNIYNFEFLPGPLVQQQNGGQAVLTINYYVNNVTMVTNAAPRKFEYTFNASLFNFENTANGETLPSNSRLNLIIPKGSIAVAIYPLPDSPQQNFIGNYTNATAFSWYSGEPLSGFTFQYVTTQSVHDEVVSYFDGIYKNYSSELYLGVVIIVGLVAAYGYSKYLHGKSKD